VRGVLEGASDEELDMRSAARWPESFHQGVLPWSEVDLLLSLRLSLSYLPDAFPAVFRSRSVTAVERDPERVPIAFLA